MSVQASESVCLGYEELIDVHGHYHCWLWGCERVIDVRGPVNVPDWACLGCDALIDPHDHHRVCLGDASTDAHGHENLSQQACLGYDGESPVNVPDWTCLGCDAHTHGHRRVCFHDASIDEIDARGYEGHCRVCFHDASFDEIDARGYENECHQASVQVSVQACLGYDA